ncbi:MAG: MFS transporter [Diaphorobacter sp.]|nr:MFS transporter [Diaphorobacter sp.]
MNKNSTTLHTPTLGLRLLLILCALAVVSQLYLPLPILPQLAHDLCVAPGVAAGVMSAFGLAYAAGFMVFGPLSDHLGRRRVMAWGLAALALISGTIAWTDSAPVLIAGRALQGFIAAAFPPVVIAYLAERGTPHQRTWGVAWISTAFLSAGLLGQIYGGAVAGRWGLEVAMLPLALVYACTALALLMAPADVRQASGPSSWLTGYRPLGRLLADARLRRVYGPALLLLMCFVAFYLALDTHAGTALRAQGITPLTVRAVALPAFLAPLAVAVVMSRVGAQRMVTVGLCTATAGLALCAWAGAEHLHGLLAASVLFVAGIGISVPSLIARVAGLADTPARGLAVALYTFVLFVGASLGPLLGQITAQWPLPHTLSLLAALLGMAALYVFTGRNTVASAMNSA